MSLWSFPAAKPRADRRAAGYIIEQLSTRVKRFWFILAAIVVLAALVVPTPLYVRQDLGWIDAISGSQKSQTVWRVGETSPPIVSDSLLAERYRTLGLKWEPDWRDVRGTYLNVFGRSVGRAHGSAPEIYNFAFSQDLQRSYLAASSDAELHKFFRIMSTGTEAEKKVAVETACNKALSEYATTRPGG